MRVKVDDLGMDFSMAKGLLAAHRISAHPWFSVFYVFSLWPLARWCEVFVHTGLVRIRVFYHLSWFWGMGGGLGV